MNLTHQTTNGGAVIAPVARLGEDICWSISLVLIKWLVLPWMFAPLLCVAECLLG